ncbi:hypothetical protein ACLQ2R_25165 [Streptosporangium sp. DT93]|uniref:hypothetical protein n=1 Tax=Streptosporangium sp. DT93 TaxID=3393428 RepID=UPI003CF07119
MRRRQGLLRAGVIVAGVLAYGAPALAPASASATSPAANPAARLTVPARIPRPVPAPDPAPSSPAPVSRAPQAVSLTRVVPAPPAISPASTTVRPSLPLARPILGHFGTPAGRPLRGRITTAVPAGETLGFRVTDPALLPAGITIDADGLLGGASRVPGIWTVPVEVCTRTGGCAPGAVTITVTAPCAASPADPSRGVRAPDEGGAEAAG